MNQRVTLAAHMHIEGFENFHRDSFNKKKVRAAFRKAGRLVQDRARLNLSLSGAGSNYPRKITGELRDSIKFRVSRSGFMVKVMPEKTAGMEEYYPAFLHYGVKKGARVKGTGGKRRRKGERQSLIEARNAGGWRIKPRANYIADALEDESRRVQSVLRAGFAAALG